MRLSRFLPRLFAGAGLLLSWPGVAPAEWFGHHHRRPFQWMEPSVPAVVPGSPAPEVKSEPITPGTPVPQATAEPPVSPSPLQSAALGDTSFEATQPGYLDSAIPMTQFRLRYDSAYNFTRPDRAEFFYPKCGCFPDGRGPRLIERSVDYQETSAYVEVAPTERVSGFIEVPIRYINPDINDNSTGLGDLRVGFKGALLYSECEVLTFQFRTFIPTGDGRRGLGTEHYTVEPSLLYWRKLSDRLQFFGQVGDWIPIDGTDFQGNVFFYGAGLAYAAYQGDNVRISPIAELLGWSVLNGEELDLASPGFRRGSEGTDIINAKLGVRADAGRQSIYAGYGRAITGEQWYQDIFRLEYRLRF